MSTKAVIVSFARTPIAKFRGSFASMSAPELGSLAIRAAVDRLMDSGIESCHIDEAFMGNVVSSGIGQAPCRQAVIGAGLSVETICTTVNKVCASGMKAAILAAQSVQLDSDKVIVAGGMESMSNIPHYITQLRSGQPLGHTQVLDGVIHDGLWDVYSNQHMGMCAEKCATDFSISREEQDDYAKESYSRSQKALSGGKFENEIVPVEVTLKRGSESKIISHDEEPFQVKLEQLDNLKPAFKRDHTGTVTAANASSLNDGAAAMVIMNEAKARLLGLPPLAQILSHGEAAQEPVNFTTTPSKAVHAALKNAGMSLRDIDYHEINEAFSVVSIANMKLLDLDPMKVNAFGGAVSLGHPIGMSGSRIMGTLYSVLKDTDSSIGCASICNGGKFLEHF